MRLIHSFINVLVVCGSWVCVGYAEETIVATAPHRFWITNRDINDDGRFGEWVEAEDLRVGDQFLTADGRTARLKEKKEKRKEENESNVTGVEQASSAVGLASPFSRPWITYNFEVADSHTYFVGLKGLWVHNDCDDRVLDTHFFIADRDYKTRHIYSRPKHSGDPWHPADEGHNAFFHRDKDWAHQAYVVRKGELDWEGYQTFVTPSSFKEMGRSFKILDWKGMGWNPLRVRNANGAADRKALYQLLRRSDVGDFDARIVSEAWDSHVSGFETADMGLIYGVMRHNHDPIAAHRLSILRNDAKLQASVFQKILHVYETSGIPLAFRGKTLQVYPFSVEAAFFRQPWMWSGFPDFIINQRGYNHMLPRIRQGPPGSGW